MIRVAAIAVALIAAVALAYAATPESGPDNGFDVVLDNAFGLTTGADVRVAGVTVGSVADITVQSATARAVVRADIARPEFGGMRTDAFCAVEPQSLIGEYFLNCDPGTAQERLPNGGTVPVEQTAGTIPPDLVTNILRRPYRERLGLLIGELGAGFAARGGDVNATISRAIPALRETDRVLAILSEERARLKALTRDSARTLAALDEGRDGVARFVTEAGNAATASANRSDELAGTIRRLPPFLRELRPTLAALEDVARKQTPALADLRRAAPALTTLLQRLGPFAEASRPAIRALGRASRTGRAASRAAAPTVRRLRALAGTLAEPSTNLRFVLEHLDDRDNAVEENAQSPTGRGFTGLEALLQYFFRQSQAINLFDDRGYILKLGILVNECTQYTDAAHAARDPERAKRCSAALGPGGPQGEAGSTRESSGREKGDRRTGSDAPADPAPGAGDPNPPAPSTPAPRPGPGPSAPSAPPSADRPGIAPAIEQALDFLLRP